MRHTVFFFILLYTCLVSAQVKFCSWNLSDFGKRKQPETIAFIANTVKEYDVVAIQEVVAGFGGAQAVARLATALNRTGDKWDYTVSVPTTGSSYKTERYAFLWKTARIRKVKAELDPVFQLEIDREPYYGTFSYKGKLFTVVNFHAITKSRQPETEIKHFKKVPLRLSEHNLVFAGDFNCPESHTVFNPLKGMGFQPVFRNQKTSLRQRCIAQDCLASEFDNIFYNVKKIRLLNKKAHLFYTKFESLALARKVSDHIPIGCTFLLL
ncbi:MAG: endonuclease [Flavobacterium sp.]|nr:endonuclease [Flavobacterium sp.]